MLRVELKRILKTRSTWRLAAIALAICLASAFSTVRQVVKYIDHGDEPTEIVRGVAVYEENRERYSVIRGEVTPELFASAVALHHELLARYGTDYDIPPDISSSVLGPYSPVFTWIYYAFSDEFGAALTSADISPERAQNYYQERLDTLERTLNEKYEQTPQVVEYAMSRLSAESGNFYYSYGISSTNAFSSLGLCALLVTLICVVITAPIFSSDYASGADDILHCTRHGRGRLAAAKMGSALLIDLGVFALCFGPFLAVMYFAFGFDDITSAELLQVALNPQGLDAMGVLGWIALSSLLAFLAVNAFTLFVSSRLRSSLGVVAISAAVALIPTIIRMFMAGGSFGHGFAAAEGNLLNWLRLCLPSGGVSLTGAMMDELTGLRFLWIGDFVTWSPYVMLTATAVQIPIWFALTVRAYRRHGS